MAPPSTPRVGANPFQALSQEKRAHLELIAHARADAVAGHPEGAAAFAAQTEAFMGWLDATAAQPANAPYREFFTQWRLDGAALWLAARPVADRAAAQARYAALAADLDATQNPRARAMVVAAAKDLIATAPKLAVGSPSETVRAALGPAIGHLARSKDPVAQDLARRIDRGEIPLKVTAGGKYGIQYFAMVQIKGISVSNGEVGPDFFALSPPFQAAVLRHEFEHVGQKSTVLGFLKTMGSNLAQRFCALASLIPGVDDDAMEVRGRRWNRTEQAAYRVEKAFLAAQGWGQDGMTSADVGMLVGVDTWLEADAG